MSRSNPRLLVVPVRLWVWVALPVATAHAVTLAAEVSSWRGLWAYTATTLNLALLLALPAVATAAAWIASLHRSGGVFEASSHAARSRIVVEARQFSEVALPVACVVALCSVGAWAATWPIAVVGAPDVMGLAARVAISWAVAAFGYSLGRSSPRMVALPVAAVVPYVAIGVCQYFAIDLLGVLTPIDDRFTPFSVDLIVVPVLQTVLWTVVTLAVVAFFAERPASGVGLLWAGGMFAAVLILIGTADRRHVESAAAPACTASEQALVCLPRATSFLAAPLADDVAFVLDALPGLAPPSASWIEEYVEWGAEPGDVWVTERESAMERGYDTDWVASAVQLGMSTDVDHEQVRLALVSSLFASWNIPGSMGEPTTNANEALLHWTLVRFDLPRVGSDLYATRGSDDFTEASAEHDAEMEWFEGLSEGERAEFFRRNATAIRTGTLEWTAFGDAPA